MLTDIYQNRINQDALFADCLKNIVELSAGLQAMSSPDNPEYMNLHSKLVDAQIELNALWNSARQWHYYLGTKQLHKLNWENLHNECTKEVLDAMSESHNG